MNFIGVGGVANINHGAVTIYGCTHIFAKFKTLNDIPKWTQIYNNMDFLRSILSESLSVYLKDLTGNITDKSVQINNLGYIQSSSALDNNVTYVLDYWL